MKIAVIGYSGSGKSTLAGQLGDLYNSPVLYLDKIQFEANWKERNIETAKIMVKRFMEENNKWVIDGNYTKFFREKRCLAKKVGKFNEKLQKYGYLFPLILGLATGLNLCPTFFLVFTEAASLNSMLESVSFFFFFFLGTTLYFIPVPFIGVLAKKEELKIVGNFLIVMIGVYYLYKGFILLINYGRF